MGVNRQIETSSGSPGYRVAYIILYFHIINHLFIITRRSAGPPDTRLRIL